MKNIVRQYGIYIVLSMIISVFFELYLEIRRNFATGGYFGLLDSSYSLRLVLKLVLFFIITLIILLLLNRYKFIFRYIDKYRFFIGLAVVILCTIFEISGSSIANTYTYLGHHYDSESSLYAQGVLSGIPREIRTDEWAVLTPLNFSQEYNNFSPVSDIIRGSATDVTTFYANPNISLSTLFRPFLWGYIILGSAKGLAFYWSLRAVTLFLVSYEFGKILFNNKKVLSASFSCLILFSQLIQWWYSTNGLMEMFIFGELAIVLIYHLLHTDKLWQKALICLGLVECAGGYLLAYYPAQQIPLAYIFLAIAIYIIVSDRKLIKKTNIFLVIGTVLLFGLLSALMLYNSMDTIITTMNTAYPGKRVDTGGNTHPIYLFSYITSIFTPYNEQLVFKDNSCEMAVFFSLFPIGIICSIYSMFKEKRASLLYVMLLLIELLFITFCVTGLPTIIAKITMLSYSFNNRVLSIIGYIDLILLFSFMSKPTKTTRKVNKHEGLIKLVVSVIISLISILIIRSFAPPAKTILWLVAAVILTVIIYLILRNTADHKEKLAIFLMCIITVTGLCVNPIQKGNDVVVNNEISSRISSIQRDNPDTTWITVNDNVYINNMPITVGAKTINSVNIYPNIDLWKKIDTNGQYETIYNRYANINIDITQDNTTFELKAPDNFKVNLNYHDLDTLDIDYVLSHKELNAPNIELVDNINDFRIYKVIRQNEQIKNSF